MDKQTLLSLHGETVTTAARRIFNTYGGKRMSIRDRLEAVIDYARNVPASEISNEEMGDVLSVLDEACESGEISDLGA